MLHRMIRPGVGVQPAPKSQGASYRSTVNRTHSRNAMPNQAALLPNY
jgi:hypothetical protein